MAKVGHLFWVVTFISLKCSAYKVQHCKNGHPPSSSGVEMLDYLTDPCRYDKLARPNAPNRTAVYVHIHVYYIGSIDTQFLRYTAQVILRYRWRDIRLRQNNTVEEIGGVMDKIWSPHGYIVNEQDAKVMGVSRKDVMDTIHPDGTVIVLSRTKLILRCEMHFQKFPFDSQRCPLIIESWQYNASELQLLWEPDFPVTIDRTMQMQEYTLEDVILNNSTVQYGPTFVSGVNDEGYYNINLGKHVGNFSALAVYFALKRQCGFYIMDYYVPSILIVVVSWVSFWLDANSTPGRVALGTSTLLTFITLSRNMGNSLPKVSYIKSSEIWFIGCTGFIFLSLTEFAFVNIVWRRKKDVTLKKVTSKHILEAAISPQLYRKHASLVRSSSNSSILSMGNLSNVRIQESKEYQNHTITLSALSGHQYPHYLSNDISTISFPVPDLHPKQVGRPITKTLLTMTPQEVANWIDRRSRIMFPIAFIVFNFFYWMWTFLF